MDGPTTRRGLLSRGGLAVLATISVAGCTEEIGEEFPPNVEVPVSEITPELPVTERTEFLEEGITAFDDAEIDDLDTFAEKLVDYGIEVESVREALTAVSVEYVNTDLHRTGNLQDIAPIAGAYAALIDSGYESEFLDVTILDPASTSFGAAEVGTDLAERYNDGELTATEYGELVASTIDSKRHPPEVGASPEE
ncbi:hypothetical protein [Natronorarus salvus]|uniref:hypothetical protein n=1 Tax=Natronorarus salvus TaxID=3117733 RepID=UPI002F26963D